MAKKIIYSILIIFVILAFFFAMFVFPNNTVELQTLADWTSNTVAITAGNGTENNPYVIDSAQKLAYMALQCNNNAGNFQSAYYIQTTNIDISTDEWVPINSFSGVYDGQGYTISGLKNTTRNRFSFFDILNSSSVIRNLGFTNVNINRSGWNNYAIAVLANDSHGIVENCFASGTIDISISGGTNGAQVGGLVKWIAEGRVSNCYVNLNINVDNYYFSTGDTHAGGICQQIDSGIIENCYSIGTLHVYGGYWKVAGIAAYPKGGTIRNCAVLINTCTDNDTTKNDFYNQHPSRNEVGATTENCSVVSSETLKNSASAPLSSWEWNTVNAFPRTWGFVSDNNSEFYNQGYPQLRVFYENFQINFYDETGSTLYKSINLRYPQYSVNFNDLSIPSKTGYTYNGQFSTEPNGAGNRYSSPITNICSNMNLYVVYDANIHHLTIATSNNLAGEVVLKDEDVAYGTSIEALVSSVNLGYRFVEWKNAFDDSTVSNDLSYVFSMPDNDVSLIAIFMEETYFLKVVVNNLDYGYVTGTGDYFTVGEQVTLTAIANPGYQIDKFYLENGQILSQTETLSYTMPRENVIIYVDFVQKQYALNVYSYPEGTATLIGSGNYYAGEQVSISFEQVSADYHFAYWKIDDVSKDNADYVEENIDFIMPAQDTDLYCYFIPNDKSYVAFIGLNGQILFDEEISLGYSVTPPADYEVENYNFLGWFDSQVDGNKQTNFENITVPKLILYAHYEKIFACDMSISVEFIQNDQYKTDLSFALFYSMRSPSGLLISSALYNNSNVSISLPEEGSYMFTYVVPTYYDVKIYYNGFLINEKSFVVDLYAENVQLNFVVENTNDYLLYDNSSNFSETSIEQTYNVDPVVNVDGENVYVGTNNVVSNLEFEQLTSSQLPQSPYGYQIKDVLGATNWGGLYNFTELDYLLEGAYFVANDMDSTVYKFALANNYASMYPFNSDWGNKSINSMTDLAKTDIVKTVLSLPQIKTYVLIAYEFVYCPWEKVITDNYSLEDLEIYYQYVKEEFANLTEYLLTEYKDDEKIFILSNWEGDNAYGPIFDLCQNDQERQLLTDAYVGYINARQDGIIEGRSRVEQSSSKVYGNFEVCHVGSDIPSVPNRWRLVDVAIPYTYCDLYSLSDWYTYLQDEEGNYLFPLEDVLNEIYNAAQTNLCYTDPDNYPLNPDFAGKKNVMVTEFGYDENTDENYFAKIQHETESAIEWGVYKLIYWEVYSNVNLNYDENLQPLHERPRNEDMQGLWLIRPDGTFTKAFWYFKSLSSGIDYFSTTPKIVFNMTYKDSEGLDWDLYKDKIIFNDDLVDSSKMKHSSFTQDRLSFYTIDSSSDNYQYFKNYTDYFGEVDTSGIIQNQNDFDLSYIAYDMISNRFGIILYNYTDFFLYTDINYNPLNMPIVIEGLTKENTWEVIDNLSITQTLDPERDESSPFWYQTYISGIVPVGYYSELRISFNPKGYNNWDPIITSVIFFEGGQV